MSQRWDRLEPSGRDEDLEQGLQARVADPLWMLARQWQLGEFRGEDAGSPIHARVFLESNPVTSFRNDARPDAPVEPFPRDRPLEARVEAEGVVDGPAAIGLAAEAGTQFLRRLSAAGLDDLRAEVDWRRRFPIELDGLATDKLPPRVARRLALLARRGVDGRKLHGANNGQLRRMVGADNWTRLAPVVQAWRREYGDRFSEPGPGGPSWLDERLEYGFSVGVRSRAGEVVLRAQDYAGGHLDWYDFRVDEQASHDLKPGGPKPARLDRLPMPVSFRGQPAARWWEFEDRRVYFGNLAAGPADLARLVVAEFASVFSDDWYIVPARVEVGTLNRVTRLAVFDVFGERHLLEATAVNDHRALGGDRPWACFELEGDRSPAQGRAPWLFVPPALASASNGRPVESVAFVRDEAANLGWAIEQRIELPTGASMERRQQWTREPPGEARSDEAARDEPWRWRLHSPVPPWWIPLIPERVAEGSADTRLRRARMQSWAELDPDLVGPKGRVVGVRRPLFLFEEEVPRGGVLVTRHWQHARDLDGRVHLWMARRKRPGRGERASGLEFDGIERS